VGKFASKQGSTVCDDCAAGTTQPLTGQFQCISSSSASLDALVSGNNSFYLTALIAVLCGAVAIFIDRAKKARKHVILQADMLSAISQFALFGSGLVSQFFLASGLIGGSGGFKAVGAVIIASRLINFYPTILVFRKITMKGSGGGGDDKNVNATAVEEEQQQDDANSLKHFVDTIHFFKNAALYNAVLFLSAFDCTLLVHLPWLKSPFSELSHFPNKDTLRLVLAIKMLQISIVLACQIATIVLVKSTLSETALDFLYLNLAISVTSFVFGFAEGALKFSLLVGTEIDNTPTFSLSALGRAASEDALNVELVKIMDEDDDDDEEQGELNVETGGASSSSSSYTTNAVHPTMTKKLKALKNAFRVQMAVNAKLEERATMLEQAASNREKQEQMYHTATIDLQERVTLLEGKHDPNQAKLGGWMEVSSELED